MLYKTPEEYEEELSLLKRELFTLTKLNTTLTDKLNNYLAQSVLEDDDKRLRDYLIKALKVKLELERAPPQYKGFDGEREDFFDHTYPIMCHLNQQLSLIVKLATEFKGRKPEPNEPIAYGIFVLLEPILRYLETILEKYKGFEERRFHKFFFVTSLFEEFLLLSTEEQSKLIEFLKLLLYRR